MIKLNFSIYFDKFNQDRKEVTFSTGINLIYGDSGVGKSILLSYLQGECPSHSHNFKVNIDTSNYSFYRIYQNPDHQIIGRTIKGELSFAGECKGLQPNELKTIIEDGFLQLPKSVSPNTNPGLLSGGEKELLNLTTAIQSNPTVLIIDDGLSFLSSENKLIAMERLEKWTRETGSIVIWASSEKEDLLLGGLSWKLELDSFERIKKNTLPTYEAIQIPKGYLSLKFKDITFQYENSRPIYSNFDINIAQSRSVGLLGGNGSGKTTFSGLCFGYLNPQKGTVSLSIDGRTNLKIGYADQFPEHLIQLKTPGEFLEQLIENKLFDQNLTHTFQKRIARFGFQWETVSSLKGVDLPWAVLRTIVIVLLSHCKFDLLILDEPTFGLGWNQRVILRSFLRESMAKIHFMIVSHDIHFIQSICDQIIDLDTKEKTVTKIGKTEKAKS
ncbi:ATP-binding cassette domain-containing protein [Candidatus Marinimicrobia bacterium]|nr:ATP-binding cassette domain-containing protein [Candidatus Neomarinimicrobiota bacterium]MDC1037833.1 ATP-binding cassette domain-containing protein [Candidatus Neomarinimicrobiota bacterium]